MVEWKNNERISSYCSTRDSGYFSTIMKWQFEIKSKNEHETEADKTAREFGAERNHFM